MKTVTLWDAYLLANRRCASLSVDLADDAGLGNGRTERSLRVSSYLINDHVAVQQGSTADWIFVPVDTARAIHVSRPLDH